MNKKIWTNPEVYQLGVESTQHNTLHSNRIDKTYIGPAPDEVKHSDYS